MASVDSTGGVSAALIAALLAGATIPGGLSLQSFLTTGGSISVFGGAIDVKTAGQGLQVAEGANAKQGVVTLVAGSAVVANTSVTATSRIFLTAQSLGTVGVPQALAVTARTPGTSFTITSAGGTDTSVVAYEIYEAG
jgi:hypothetical protein